MNPEELIAPGMYTDAATGDIWEKSEEGNWRVNGMPHKPFPVSLVPVQTKTFPTVSIDDAVAYTLERKRNAQKETGSI